MSKELTVIDTKIVRAHLEGKTSPQIAKEVMPDKKNGDILVRQRLRKLTLRDAVNAELLKQGVTLADVLAPVAKGIKAQNRRIEYKTTRKGSGKDLVVTTEPVEHLDDNLPLQLSAHDRAVKLLGIDKMHEADTETPPLDEEELKELAGAADEVEMTRILFKKNKG